MSLPLPVYRDRPSVIPHQGGRVFISPHDAEYLRQKAEWKQKLADAHPDRSGRPALFRKLTKQRAQWEAAEAKWYAQYGLEPPAARAAEPIPADALPRIYSRHGQPGPKHPAIRHVLALLADRRHHSVNECCLTLNVTANYLYCLIRRLRQRGFDIAFDPPIRTGLSAGAYRLITAPVKGTHSCVQ